jgi:alginate O-acetyltransferase complex protein AlgI
VLFNTLTYAKFFAVVFTMAWLLTNRRWAPLLPWLAVGGFVSLVAPTAAGSAVAAAALLVTLGLCARGSESGPRPSEAIAAVVANAAALTFLIVRHEHSDPITLVLRAFGVPVPDGIVWSALFALAGAIPLALVIRARRVRLLFILGASYVFYAHWDWRFLPLIFGSSTIDWLLGNAIGGETDPRKRRRWLVGTVILNLGVLGIFKYFDFGVDTARSVLDALGYHPPELALRIALPVGISFFTFESMSYVIDVYRGDIRPQKSYVEYLSFVAFFPHLIAGPIVRPRDLLPQLAGPARFSAAEGSEGLFLIAVGLLKKVAIGDYLALNLVDRVFDSPAQYSAIECYAAVLGYAVQIYCDFSGYTDIAIGSALLLGVRFPLNFDAPYKALDIQDFWRRWHISLSTWLRDYLYIPLGGNRGGSVRTYVNLLLTMLLGGLWHGASWTFVAWGGLHGAALAVTRALRSRFEPSRNGPLLRSAVAAFLTFHFVCFCWIFFRAETFRTAWSVLSQLGTLTTFVPNLHAPVVVVLAVGLLSHWMPEQWYGAARGGYQRLPGLAQAAVLFVVTLVLREMASADAVPFVYFQF